jgi:hypothetical protein
MFPGKPEAASGEAGYDPARERLKQASRMIVNAGIAAK